MTADAGTASIPPDLLNQMTELWKALELDPGQRGPLVVRFHESMSAKFGPSGAHFAMLLRTITEARTHVEVTISGGVVGNLNLGSQVGHVNTAVTALSGSSDATARLMADALRRIVEAVGASDLQPGAKREAIELLAELAKQSTAPPGQRSSAVVKSIIGSLPQTISTVAALGDIWTTVLPAIRTFFSLP